MAAYALSKNKAAKAKCDPAPSGTTCDTMTTTFKINFPSVHGAGHQAFHAEADAPTEALAVRSVLEACAAQGMALQYVVLKNITGLVDARLDGLKLTGCKLDSVDLSGASLRGAVIKESKLYSVLANERTHLDDAMVWGVEFEGCDMNGIHAPRLNADTIRFYRCTVNDWHVEDAQFDGLLARYTQPTGWKASMASIRNCSDFEGILERADLTENQKAAVRSMSTFGDRASAQSFLDALEALGAAAA